MAAPRGNTGCPQEDENTVYIGDGLYARITSPVKFKGDLLLMTQSGSQVYLTREALSNLMFLAETGMVRVVDKVKEREQY